MWTDILRFSFWVGVIGVWLRIATPLVFSSTGVLVAARSGIMDLSGEGAMIMGALGGFLAAYFSGSVWVGVLVGAVAGLLTACIVALMAVGLKMDQAVSAIAVDIFAEGLAFYLFRASFEVSAQVPSIRTFDVWRIPFLSKIPLLGQALFSQHLLTYLAFVVALLVWFFLYRTKHGLILRFTGENPRAVDTKGISVERVQFLSYAFSGLMNGLAGAFLPLVCTGLFVPGITAGRGWIAFSLIIFGRFRSLPVVLGSLLFGLLETMNLQIQGLGIQFPYQILVALPYVLTIVALVVGRKESGQPLHLGIPYRRESG